MDDVVKKLEIKGVNPTAMRLLIYKYLAGTNMAVSLGEIESNFKSSERSTLFRTIKKFEEKQSSTRY